MPNVKLRGTKPVAKRIPRAQGFRLAATELRSGVRWNTRPNERIPDNVKRRRPKVKVNNEPDANGHYVVITTRRTMKLRVTKQYPWMASTAPLKKRWSPTAK